MFNYRIPIFEYQLVYSVSKCILFLYFCVIYIYINYILYPVLLSYALFKKYFIIHVSYFILHVLHPII